MGAGAVPDAAVHDVGDAGRGPLRHRAPAEGRHKDRLLAAADDVFTTFADRVLAFDAAAAVHYADVAVARARAGAPISGFDAQIAAVCRRHQATLATRHINDFNRLGLDLVNPWTDGEGTSR